MAKKTAVRGPTQQQKSERSFITQPSIHFNNHSSCIQGRRGTLSLCEQAASALQGQTVMSGFPLIFTGKISKPLHDLV